MGRKMTTGKYATVEELHNRIIYLRKHSDLTVEEIAKEVGISKPTLIQKLSKLKLTGKQRNSIPAICYAIYLIGGMVVSSGVYLGDYLLILVGLLIALNGFIVEGLK